MDARRAHFRAVAEAAYIFIYPLVMSYADLYAQTIDPSSPLHSGGCASWRRPDPGLPTSVDRPTDGPYSVAWLDLRAEPWVVRVQGADVHSGIRTTISDLWGFTVDGPAPSMSRGVGEALVMLASSSWLGEIPDDIDRLVRGESSFLRLVVAPVVGQHEDPDLPALNPLSVHRGHKPTAQPAPIDWVLWRPGSEITDRFWSCANFALSLTERYPDDEPVLDRIADIGVVAGEPWDPTWFDAGMLAAINRGVDDAVSSLLRQARPLPPLQHAGLSRRDMDGDYFARALTSLRDSSLIGVEAMEHGRAWVRPI